MVESVNRVIQSLSVSDGEMESMDFAVMDFTEMKNQPSLERALMQKKILKA